MRDETAAKVLARADRAGVPLSLTIELTHRCNLGCIHCYAECGGGRASGRPTDAAVGAAAAGGSAPGRSASGRSAPGRGSELTTAAWADVLSQAAALGSLYLAVTGGEPLLRTDLVAILRAARELRFAVRLFTNATLVDRATAVELAGLPLVAAEVSVYAASPEVHDRVTGVPGSHARMLEGVGHLVTRGVRVVGKMPVMSVNAGEVEAAFRLADEVGITLRVDPMITPTTSGDFGPSGLRIDKHAYRELVRQLLDRGTDAGPVERGPEDPLCGAGRTQMAVGPTGLLYPCVGFPESAADLLDVSLADAWSDSSLFRRLRGTTSADLESCADCELAAYCRRCPGIALLETGSERAAVSYACMMAAECREAERRR